MSPAGPPPTCRCSTRRRCRWRCRWAPSYARNSALIEKLNITALHDDNRTAWTLGEAFSDATIKGGTRSIHPENVGVTLTREERVKLIRAIDMGGQFYSRQNTGFEPMAR